MFKLKISTKQSGAAKHEKKSSSSRTRQQQDKPGAGKEGGEGGALSLRYILKQIYVAQRQALKAEETEVSSRVGGRGKQKVQSRQSPLNVWVCCRLSPSVCVCVRLKLAGKLLEKLQQHQHKGRIRAWKCKQAEGKNKKEKNKRNWPKMCVAIASTRRRQRDTHKQRKTKKGDREGDGKINS